MDFIISMLRRIVAIAVVVITVGAFFAGGSIGGTGMSFGIGPAIGSGILGLILSVVVFGVVALLIKIEENTRGETNANIDTKGPTVGNVYETYNGIDIKIQDGKYTVNLEKNNSPFSSEMFVKLKDAKSYIDASHDNAGQTD